MDEKSNEIRASPELLESLELAGCIVTIDAIGCQTEIAAKIIDRQAEFVLAVKDNLPHLQEDMADIFKLYLQEENPLQYLDDHHKTVEKDHGRIETRECWVVSASGYEQSVRGAAN